jgi:LPS O-antigen subunit length determinant protein (WzzB/FepE family)
MRVRDQKMNCITRWTVQLLITALESAEVAEVTSSDLVLITMREAKDTANAATDGRIQHIAIHLFRDGYEVIPSLFHAY